MVVLSSVVVLGGKNIFYTVVIQVKCKKFFIWNTNVAQPLDKWILPCLNTVDGRISRWIYSEWIMNEVNFLPVRILSQNCMPRGNLIGEHHWQYQLVKCFSAVYVGGRGPILIWYLVCLFYNFCSLLLFPFFLLFKTDSCILSPRPLYNGCVCVWGGGCEDCPH